MRKFYVRLCRKWGPGGMTLSAYSWRVAQKTGNTFWRDRIDGAWLLFGGGHNHCQSAFQRESVNPGD
jgi:hypothetical protein